MFPLFKMIAARNSSSGPAPSITSYWSTSAPLPYATRKINVNVAPGVAKSTGGGARNLEWTIGTKEAYILKIPGGIDSAVIDRTLDNIAAGNMLFVNNYARARAAALSLSDASSTSTSKASANTASDETSSSQSNTLAIIGIVMGAVGLVAGVGALLLVESQKNTVSALAGSSKQIAMAEPPKQSSVVHTLDVEEASSIDSKAVN